MHGILPSAFRFARCPFKISLSTSANVTRQPTFWLINADGVAPTFPLTTPTLPLRAPRSPRLRVTLSKYSRTEEPGRLPTEAFVASCREHKRGQNLCPSWIFSPLQTFWLINAEGATPWHPLATPSLPLPVTQSTTLFPAFRTLKQRDTADC